MQRRADSTDDAPRFRHYLARAVLRTAVAPSQLSRRPLMPMRRERGALERSALAAGWTPRGRKSPVARAPRCPWRSNPPSVVAAAADTVARDASGRPRAKLSVVGTPVRQETPFSALLEWWDTVEPLHTAELAACIATWEHALDAFRDEQAAGFRDRGKTEHSLGLLRPWNSGLVRHDGDRELYPATSPL